METLIASKVFEQFTDHSNFIQQMDLMRYYEDNWFYSHLIEDACNEWFYANPHPTTFQKFQAWFSTFLSTLEYHIQKFFTVAITNNCPLSRIKVSLLIYIWFNELTWFLDSWVPTLLQQEITIGEEELEAFDRIHIIKDLKLFSFYRVLLNPNAHILNHITLPNFLLLELTEDPDIIDYPNLKHIKDFLMLYCDE